MPPLPITPSSSASMPMGRRAALTGSLPLLSSFLLPQSTSANEQENQTSPRSRHIGKKFKRSTLQMVKKSKLPCGLQLSRIIQGTKQLDGQHGHNDRRAIEDFERFFSSGITSIDTADVFGPSESSVGDYLRLMQPPFTRKDVQVMTQVTISSLEARRLSRQMLELKVRTTMKRVGLSDRIDLLSLHWEDYEALGLNDAMKWLMDIKESGLISHLGLSNIDTSHLIEILDHKVEIGAVRVAYSVIDRRPELFMSQVCEAQGIAILPHGCLSGGFLTDAFLGRPANKVTLDTPTRRIYGQQLKMQGGWSYMQDVLGVLNDLAIKHKTSIGAIALKWVLMQQAVAAVVVGARSASHLRDLQVAALDGWTLDEEDMLAIDAAQEGATRNAQHDCFTWERGGPW